MVAEKVETWTGKEESDARTMLARLDSYNQASYSKWQRNFGRYQNNGKMNTVSLWSIRDDVVPGYNPWVNRGKVGYQTSINTLKSAVDTVVSKMSQARVRPFFQAVHGDYKTIKSCRAAQEFFDGYFERENIYHSGALALRDACIFDKGILWIDEDTENIRLVKPWQVSLDPSEYEYGEPTRMSILFKDYPVRLVEKFYGKEPKLKKRTWKNQEEADEFQILYDLLNGEKWYFYGGELFRRVKIDYKRLPIVLIYWTPPLKGLNSTSLIDENYSLQVDIDELNQRIDAATRNGIVNTVFVPKGSGVKPSKLSNEAAEIQEYDPGPAGAPVVVVTPPAINDQYITLLRLRIQTVFENAGISQMSAQSKKPTGADSGRALQTLADIESERFNLTLQAYLRMFIDLASVCIDVFPEDADIVSGKYSAKAAKWRDVKKQRDSYNITFAAASALSKDPTRRIQEIDALVQRGMIPKEMAASLMQIPDVEGAYSVATAAYDYAQVVIEKAIEDGEITFEAVTNMELLFAEAMRWLLRLSSDEANEKYISNLKKLIEAINTKLSEVEAPAQGQAAPAVAPPVAPIPQPTQAQPPALPGMPV